MISPSSPGRVSLYAPAVSSWPAPVRTAVNGIELDVVAAGDPADPAVVLCHGFPECGYSWRHQLHVVADAGFHVIVPDQRGYGASSRPADVDAYGIDHLAGDLLGLLDATGHDDAVFVGHDWGALVVWDLARLHPEQVRGVVNVSVPYTSWPAPPTAVMRALWGDRFFYILYFQAVGPPEAELEAEVERTMRTILWSGSGEAFPETMPEPPPRQGTGFLDSMAALGPVPDDLPGWLTEDDLAVYVDAFRTSGFFGPLSWYRNFDANYFRVKDLAVPSMPSWFIAGTRDVVIAARPGYVEAMEALLPHHRRTVLIDGIGHWTQQEAPGSFNEALLAALDDLRRPGAGASGAR
jgi:pimeloyl-ACP methyl ester carboxylesterase